MKLNLLICESDVLDGASRFSLQLVVGDNPRMLLLAHGSWQLPAATNSTSSSV